MKLVTEVVLSERAVIRIQAFSSYKDISENPETRPVPMKTAVGDCMQNGRDVHAFKHAKGMTRTLHSCLETKLRI